MSKQANKPSWKAEFHKLFFTGDVTFHRLVVACGKQPRNFLLCLAGRLEGRKRTEPVTQTARMAPSLSPKQQGAACCELVSNGREQVPAGQGKILVGWKFNTISIGDVTWPRRRLLDQVTQSHQALYFPSAIRVMKHPELDDSVLL